MISPKWASNIMSASYRLDLCFEQNLNIFYQGYFSLPTTRAIRISFLLPHSEKLVGFLQIKPRELREGVLSVNPKEMVGPTYTTLYRSLSFSDWV